MTPDFNTQAERVNAQFTRGIITEHEYFTHVGMLLFQESEERCQMADAVCASCSQGFVLENAGTRSEHFVLRHTDDCLVAKLTNEQYDYVNRMEQTD